MNVSKIVPSVMERLSIKENSRVTSLFIESLDSSKKMFLNEDIFQRYSKKDKDTPKNLFELLKRLLSPQKDDVSSVVERLSFPSYGYKVSAEITSGKNTQEVSGIVMSHGGGFTSVGASSVSCEKYFRQPNGIIADGYLNGLLISSENHSSSGVLYYRDIVKSADGKYQAGKVTDSVLNQ